MAQEAGNQADQLAEALKASLSPLRRPQLPRFEPTADPIRTAKKLTDYIKKFELEARCLGITATADKKNMLELTGGPHFIEISEHMPIPTGAEADNDYIQLKKKILHYHMADKLKSHSRFQFNLRKQEQGESFMDFYKALLDLAADCDFGDQKDALILDRLVAGTHSDKIRRKALEKKHTLAELITYAAASAQADAQANALNGGQKHHVNRLHFKFKKKGHFKGQGDSQQGCSYCGHKHAKNQCPAYGKECAYCKKKNHFARCCRKQKSDKKGKSQNHQSYKPSWKKGKTTRQVTEEQPHGKSEDESLNSMADSFINNLHL